VNTTNAEYFAAGKSGGILVYDVQIDGPHYHEKYIRQPWFFVPLTLVGTGSYNKD
jgi:hypothetical protein